MSNFNQYVIDLADADTLESFYLSQTSTETGFVQLSAGPAVLSARSLDLGPLRVLQVSGDGRHLWIDNMVGEEWRFALMVSAEGPSKIGHSAIEKTTGHLLRPGETAELSTHGRYTTLEFSFDETVPMQLGWNCAAGQTARIEHNVATALRQSAGTAFSQAVRDADETGVMNSKAHWLEIFLDLIERALEPWLAPDGVADPEHSPSGSAIVVRKAHTLLIDPDYAINANADLLASKVGVSRRSLFLAFQKEYGIGPRKFRELVRLNALRAGLFRSTPDVTSVTVLAHEHGFSELGRMAARYQNLFGELPSETLKRKPRQRAT
ncbi:helix-turn-helix domain-containing protein [Primorskyibacter sp. S87]|uniref:helix-turn-helix domain-containing protein n=1 Tax=Primorskyibacter sp. S87 TaxID=3415126 RepID=UPI003C7C591E